MNSRSALAARHIAISLFAKGIGILCSLLVVPMTIDYVNPTQYGIWLTISSIIGWISFFDLGIANGFRNKFTEARARGDLRLAREYLSTTYFSLTAIVAVLLVVILAVNAGIDWTSVLNLDKSMSGELRQVFAILSVFFCINLVANTFATLLTADQKPGYASLVNCLGQILSLVSIFILTKVSEGSLLNLALYFAGIPCLVMLLSSMVAFRFSSYKALAPRRDMVRFSLIKGILGKGLQFFLIYISLILIFQIISVVLSREIGPLSVTQYNIANKYFNVLYMVMIIIINPFWSAFTDAYAKKDSAWMKSTIRNLEKVWLLSVAAGVLMLLVSSRFYEFWIGESVTIPFTLSVAMLVFVATRVLADIYMYAINGIGAIRIQLVVYLVFAALSWPCLVWSCRLAGVYGVLVFPSVVYAIQAVIGRIQLNKLISGKAAGIWAK